MKVLVNLGSRTQRWNRQSRVLGHAIRAILEATARIDQFYLQLHHVPPLYESGVRYMREPPNTTEEFATVPVILARGWGDCDDLAPWRVAELRQLGEKAEVRLQWKKSRRHGGRMYHVVVRRQNGEIEDPSALLGMRE